MVLLLGCTHGDDPQETPVETAHTAYDEPSALVFSSDPPRNLLVLSIDTVQRGYFGRYSATATTPFLDSIAAEGVVLDDHTSCAPWTLPGCECALSGRRPEEMGVVPHIVGDEGADGAIPEGELILPAMLKNAGGLSTSLVTANLYLGPRYMGAQYDQTLNIGAIAAGVVDESLTMIDAGDFSTPWMFHAHFIDPHAPYNPPEAYLAELEGRPTLDWDLSTEEGARAMSTAWPNLDAETRREAGAQLEIRYTGELRYMDDEIARLWQELDRRGMLDDTLVLVWSDHGEQLFEHGSLGHAGTLFREETGAVAFWWARNLKPAAWTEPTSHPDLVPTTLHAMGFEVPENVSGAIVGQGAADRPRFATLRPVSGPPRLSVQVGSYELMYAFNGEKRLYDLAVDPEQGNNLYDPALPEVEELWTWLLPEVERVAELIGGTATDPGP